MLGGLKEGKPTFNPRDRLASEAAPLVLEEGVEPVIRGV